MNDNIFNDCCWLTFPEVDCNLTRTEFSINNIAEAELNILGLGYMEVYINGQTVNNNKYFPPMSEYEKRDLSKINMPINDKFSYTMYYGSYNITPLLTNGKNVLAVHLGAGWYGQHKSQNEGMPKWGDNLLVFKLILTDSNGNKTFISSSPDNTVWHNSFIIESSLYFGEYHDGKLYSKNWNNVDYNSDNWNKCITRQAPDSVILPYNYPEDIITRRVKPKLLHSFGDTSIYDIGELTSGYAVLVFDEDARTNDTAVIRYADELNSDGSLQFHYCGGTNRMQKDYFIYDSVNSVKDYYPHFTWHAGRYFEITGKAKPKYFEVIHSDIRQISEFSTDNDTLNWIYEAYIRTQLADIHGCVPSDCPHRERLGYTGDGQLTAPAVMTVFDADGLYRKWLRDIRDSQDKIGGHVQHTAPFYGGGGGPGGWGGAICIVPMTHYKYYGDISVLTDYYDAMKSYISYMISRTENGLVVREEPGGWCLGDWCPPGNDIKLPEAFVNTYYLVKCAEITAETAKITGYENESEYYHTVSVNAKKSIIDHYYNSDTHSFCNGEQGADAFAVDIGLGDEITLQNLVKKYEDIRTFDTGIFGTYILISTLFNNGFADLAFDLLTNEKDASFYNMKKHGATTLWENWEGCDSRCHPMFGAVIEQFFTGIAGIHSIEPGFSKISINPPNIKKLKELHCSLGTVNGTITININTDSNGKRNISVSVPDTIVQI